MIKIFYLTLLIYATIIGQDTVKVKECSSKCFDVMFLQSYAEYIAQLDSIKLKKHVLEDPGDVSECNIIYINENIKCVNPEHYKSNEVYYIIEKPSLEGFIEYLKKYKK